MKGLVMSNGATDRAESIPLLSQPKVVSIGDRRESATRPIVRIHLLGRMQATTCLGQDILPQGKKACAILGYLCFAAGAPVPRSRLASMLWDRVPDSHARSSFRQAVRALSAAMGPLASELLSSDRDTIRLNTSLCWIDALAVLAHKTIDYKPSQENVLSLCGGVLLEETMGLSPSYDQWLIGEQTRFFEQLRERFDGEIAELDQPHVSPEQRAAIARRLITIDPTHERASRALMRSYVDMGERAQALREFARCRDALRKSLGVEPSPETSALYEAARIYSGPDACDKSPCISASRSRAHAAAEIPTRRRRIRVGVLPFLASRPPEEENLAFSLSQEIAAALARFRWFDVIAPVSLMRAPSMSSVSADQFQRTDLDYVVEGALTDTGKHLRISVRLLDLNQYAKPVWSDCFRLTTGALHQLGERVTSRIVSQIDPAILFIEGQPKRRERYGAMGLILLAIPLIYSMERQKYETAGELIKHALEMDPDDAMVAAWAAHWHVFYVGQGWTQDVQSAFETAQAHALRAIKLDPANAEAMAIHAHICSFLKKDFDTALNYFERSLRLNPNLALTWALSSGTHSYIGEPNIALKHLERYRALAPFDPHCAWFENFFTIAHTFRGAYEEAVHVGRRAVTVSSQFSSGYKPLIAALGHLGRPDEARVYVDKLLSIEPHFTIARFAEVYPIRRDCDRERYVMGLRLAGVPEV
jgi:DNA-binding SARP family transcriptional activator/Tfp pilus assembly protein PilF